MIDWGNNELGDGSYETESSSAPCQGCGPAEKRRRKALRHLGRAHQLGALAALAAGDAQLGGLEGLDPNGGPFSYSRDDVDGEQSAFDGRLNSWLADYQAHTNILPAAIVNPLDEFVERWRALFSSWYLWEWVRAKQVLAMEAEWNKLRDQVAALGAPSQVAAVTVRVGDQDFRADQLPAPPPGLFDKIESVIKWGGIIVGGVAAYKLASELGLVARLGRLVAGGGGGGSIAGVRRYGSAKRQ